MMVAQTPSITHNKPILTMEHICDPRDVLLQRRRRRHQLERRPGFHGVSDGSIALPDPLLGIVNIIRVEKRIVGHCQNIPSRWVHNDDDDAFCPRLLHPCGQFFLGDILQTFVKREIEISPAWILARIPGCDLHRAACGVTLQRNAAWCTREFVVVEVFHPAQSHTVYSHKAEYLPSQMALWVEAARLLERLHPTDVQLLQALADLWW